MENWKTMYGFDNYEISDLGNIKSRRRPGSKGGIIKSRVNNTERVVVTLTNNSGKKQTKLLHRLVAQHFLPNYYNKPQVDHINRDIHDNRVYNLRWVSDSENKLNIGLKSNNTSGKKGVYFDKTRGNWKASITIDGKCTFRRFQTYEDACKWRDEVVKIHYDDKYYTEE